MAIKVLLAQSSADLEARRRFEREARAIANLNHPNILTLHDIGSAGDVDYIVMEYLEGDTLAGFLATGHLPMDRVLGHGIALASALAAAHSQRIIHRDLKPGNIILTKSGLKVLDFGLAEFLEANAVALDDETQASRRLIVGTPGTWPQSSELAGNAMRARTSTRWVFSSQKWRPGGGTHPPTSHCLQTCRRTSASWSNAASHQILRIGGSRPAMCAWRLSA